jgi:hypothetical protein
MPTSEYCRRKEEKHILGHSAEGSGIMCIRKDKGAPLVDMYGGSDKGKYCTREYLGKKKKVGGGGCAPQQYLGEAAKGWKLCTLLFKRTRTRGEDGVSEVQGI